MRDLELPEGSNIDGNCALARDVLTLVLIAVCCATEAMYAQLIHMASTLTACMGTVEGDTETNTSSDVHHFIIKVEPQGRNRQCTRLLSLNCQKSSSRPGVCSRVQQPLLSRLNVRLVPLFLLLLHWGGRWCAGDPAATRCIFNYYINAVLQINLLQLPSGLVQLP